MDTIVRSIDIPNIIDLASSDTVMTINRVVEAKPVQPNQKIELVIPNKNLGTNVINIHSDLVFTLNNYLPRVLSHISKNANANEGKYTNL